MYKQRITEHKTKQYYKTILSDTIRMLEEEKSASGGYEMYDDILAELYDVKRNVIDSYNYSDPEEIFEKYTFGAIGVKCLDENDELCNRLSDLFYGAYFYNTFPEK